MTLTFGSRTYPKQNKMSSNIKAPPSLSKCSSYEAWLKEIQIWQAFTDLADIKQGPAIFLILEGRSREAVLELDVSKISAKDGVKTIIEKLDSLYLKDKTQSAFEAYDSFEKFRRPSEMTINEYINQFERLKAKTESYKTQLSTDVLAYRLLKSANLSEAHEQLARATITDLTYDAMKAQLKKIFSHGEKSTSKADGVVILKVSRFFNPKVTHSMQIIIRRGIEINLLKIIIRVVTIRILVRKLTCIRKRMLLVILLKEWGMTIK